MLRRRKSYFLGQMKRMHTNPLSFGGTITIALDDERHQENRDGLFCQYKTDFSSNRTSGRKLHSKRVKNRFTTCSSLVCYQHND